MVHNHLNGQIRFWWAIDSRDLGLGPRMRRHVKLGGIERSRRDPRIRTAEGMHLRSTAKVEDAHNGVRAVSEQNARAKRIVDISRLVKRHIISIRYQASAQKKTLTSTSSKTVSTNKSNSEFRQPIITPGDEDRGRSYGQNTRNKPSLMSMLSSFQPSERASTAQLFPRGNTEIHVARML